MEPLTHTLAGLALARTPIARDMARAGLVVAVAANLPDVDVAAYFVGEDPAMGFRRGWTHGPIGVVVLPALWVGVLLALRRWLWRGGDPPPSPRQLLLLSYMGCLSHPLLDWLNTYGVRFLMPFDERWFYGDAVFIVDPWLWLLLGGGLYASSPGKRVWGWIVLAVVMSSVVVSAGERIPAAAVVLWFVGIAVAAVLGRLRWTVGRRSRVLSVALAGALVYIGGLVLLSKAGAAWVRSELDRRGVAEVGRLMVGPLPANPRRWDVVAETPDHYWFGELAWFPRNLELDPQPVSRARTPMAEAALEAPGIQGTLGWMRFPYVETEERPDRHVVYVIDARYARSRRAGFGILRVDLPREASAP